MLQEGFEELALAMRDGSGAQVLVETNGSQNISRVPVGVITIMDVKTPGSGALGAFDEANLRRLRPRDEVKFVLCDRRDYEWARDFVGRHELGALCGNILFSPAHGLLDPALLGRWLLAEGPAVRLQIQLHKVLGMR